MLKLINFFLDLIFPIDCLGCRRPEVWLCPSCWAKIKIHQPQDTKPPAVYPDLDSVWIAADYQQPLLQNLIHCFKYNFVRALSAPLSQLLIDFFQRQRPSDLNFDLVIPVPLARKRLIWRSFNQAALLAEKVSETFGWRWSQKIVIRQRYTKPQVGLSRQQRQKNIEGVFKVITTSAVKDQRILLIDDVLTTGSTLSELAQTLKNAGAANVQALVIAQG